MLAVERQQNPTSFLLSLEILIDSSLYLQWQLAISSWPWGRAFVPVRCTRLWLRPQYVCQVNGLKRGLLKRNSASESSKRRRNSHNAETAYAIPIILDPSNSTCNFERHLVTFSFASRCAYTLCIVMATMAVEALFVSLGEGDRSRSGLDIPTDSQETPLE